MPQGTDPYSRSSILDPWAGGERDHLTIADAAHPTADATVRDVMVRSVVDVGPDTHFKTIAAALHEHHLTAVPVVDSERTVVGVVTASDLLTRLADREPAGPGSHDPRRWRHRRRRREGALAKDLMTSPAVTVRRNELIETAARRAVQSGVHLMPVVDDEGRLVGIVTRGDLVGWYLRPDPEILADVHRTLGEPSDYYQVSATVGDGVVTLTGHVRTSLDALQVAEPVRRLLGVIAVHNDLTYEYDDRYLGY